MSFGDEMTAPPSHVWREEPKTDVDAAPAPVLDLIHLARARRMVGEAELYTAAGLHEVAIVKARDAMNAITVALEKRDRAAFVASLAEAGAAE
jgi:hypothetical protein